MGIYVYRITSKKVVCNDGKLANVAVFAYKPYWGFDCDKPNAKMHFRSGATSSDTQASKGKITDRFVCGDENGTPYENCEVYHNSTMRGSFYDDRIGTDTYPVIEGLTVSATEKTKINQWADA
jgi:hypothetical protein